jgi:hypothetical protein
MEHVQAQSAQLKISIQHDPDSIHKVLSHGQLFLIANSLQVSSVSWFSHAALRYTIPPLRKGNTQELQSIIEYGNCVAAKLENAKKEDFGLQPKQQVLVVTSAKGVRPEGISEVKRSMSKNRGITGTDNGEE